MRYSQARRARFDTPRRASLFKTGGGMERRNTQMLASLLASLLDAQKRTQAAALKGTADRNKKRFDMLSKNALKPPEKSLLCERSRLRRLRLATRI